MNFLKSLTLIFLLTFLIACGKTEAPVAEAPVAEETVEQAATAAETTVEEAAPALSAVEESDGSFDEAAVAKEGSLRMAQNTQPAEATRFTEGKHFQRFRPTKMTVGSGDNIEVAEVFWYGCNHCYNLEPVLNNWADELPEDVAFLKIPVAWPQAEKHTRVFYTIEALGGMGAIENKQAAHMAVFDAIHVNRARMTGKQQVFELAKRFGASEDDFDKAWDSFEVNTRMNQAKTLSRAYNIQSVPAVVVNGKYITDEIMAGGKQELLAVIDELVASER
ncbi:MAG: thiol:disulfide interchange protein DsbA/DsbL [Woeseiaceae bacterium]